MQDTQVTTTSQPSSKLITEWHENPTEQSAFLDLVNFEGFLLEDVVCEILSRCRHKTELHRGKIFEGAPHRGGGRVEIDLWAKIARRVFLIESKRSEYDWVFLQNEESDKDVHIINGTRNNISVLNRTFSHITCVSKEMVEVLRADNAPTLQRQNPKQKGKTGLPIRSSRDEYVRPFLRQALFNMEVLLHDQAKHSSWHTENRTCIPLIVTNARLLSGTYSGSNIDDDAKLTKIDLQPIKVAAFNHAEILRWGRTLPGLPTFPGSSILSGGPIYQNVLSHIGWPADATRDHADKRYIGSHMKTVFIVSKDHLLDFIDHTMNWT